MLIFKEEIMDGVLLELTMNILLCQFGRSQKELLLSLPLTLIYEGKHTDTSFSKWDVIVIHDEKQGY